MFLASHFGTCFLFVSLPAFLEFGTVNPQQVELYQGKTDSFLKSPLRKQSEQIMISGSLLPSFWHHLQCFPVTDFWMICWMVVFKFFYNFWSKNGHPGWRLLAPFFDTFPTMFGKGAFECSLARFLLAPFWLIWVSFWLHFGMENLPNIERERERAR